MPDAQAGDIFPEAHTAAGFEESLGVMGLQAGGSCDGGHLDSLKKMNTDESGQPMIMIFTRFIERAFCALGA